MKAKLTLAMLFISILAIAQNSINYKAIINDSNGNILANQNVTVEFSILEGITQITAYRESHITTTNDDGLIILNIGEGTIGFGIFSEINWRAYDHFLSVRINTGSEYVNMGTTQFSAVPYAIHAENVNGLEAIDEGNGIGWRLIGRNPDNHGNIGLEAVDLSYNLTESTIRGATGAYSTAMGSLTEASATYTTALGRNTIASESGATSMGLNTIASGVISMAMGHFSEAAGDYSTAIGSQTTAAGDYSTAMGSQTTASGTYSTALGRSTTASGNSSTAMGRNTIAVSYSTAMGDETEASGSYATAMGRQTTASGNNSTAIGRSTIASALNSTAMGNETEASAASATAMGNNTTASGNFSTAMGFNTTADGAYSTAIGHYTSATGFMSTAMGNRTIAPSYAETVIGTYNTSYTPNSNLTWDAADRLFVIGNGSSSRSNAMVVLKNGNTGFGTSTPQERLHVSDGRLRIGTETIEDTGSNRLSFNADLLPDVDNAMQLGNGSFRWQSLFATDGTINMSDRRSKTNIVTLNYGLKDIMKLKPVSFNWKTNPNDDTKLGLIAQDLLKVIPEVVKTQDWETDEEGNKVKKELDRMGVFYSDLVPVLIKSIQEQQDIINSLKSTIQNNNNTIQNQDQFNVKQSKALEALLTRVNALENLLINN